MSSPNFQLPSAGWSAPLFTSLVLRPISSPGPWPSINCAGGGTCLERPACPARGHGLGAPQAVPSHLELALPPGRFPPQSAPGAAGRQGRSGRPCQGSRWPRRWTQEAPQGVAVASGPLQRRFRRQSGAPIYQHVIGDRSARVLGSATCPRCHGLCLPGQVCKQAFGQGDLGLYWHEPTGWMVPND